MRSGFSRSFPHMSSRWIQSSTSRKCSVSDLWDRRDKLTSEAVVRLALALRETGRPDDAMKLLEQHAENDTDAMGTLAGQFKRRWLLEDTKDDAERAQALYQRGYDKSQAAQNWPQAFYHGINIAFMLFSYKNDRAAAQALVTSWRSVRRRPRRSGVLRPREKHTWSCRMRREHWKATESLSVSIRLQQRGRSIRFTDKPSSLARRAGLPSLPKGWIKSFAMALPVESPPNARHCQATMASI